MSQIQLENNFMEEALVLNLSEKQAFTAKKAISFLCCISCITQRVTSRSREKILALCSARLRHSYWACGIHFWAPQHKRDKDWLTGASSPARATKMIKEWEHLSYKGRLRELKEKRCLRRVLSICRNIWRRKQVQIPLFGGQSQDKRQWAQAEIPL